MSITNALDLIIIPAEHLELADDASLAIYEFDRPTSQGFGTINWCGVCGGPVIGETEALAA